MGGESPADEMPAPTAERTLTGLPSAFVPNEGQAHPDVLFSVHGLGGDTLFFTHQGAILVLPPAGPIEASVPEPDEQPQQEPAPPMRAVLRIRFEGANRTPQVSGAEASMGPAGGSTRIAPW